MEPILGIAQVVVSQTGADITSPLAWTLAQWIEMIALIVLVLCVLDLVYCVCEGSLDVLMWWAKLMPVVLLVWLLLL